MSDDVYTRRIEEHIEPGLPRLGRHVHHDPRSRDYVADTAPTIQSVAHQAQGLPLDQGQWGSCTGNALAGALNSLPDFKGTVLTEKEAFGIYQLETKLEGYTTPPDDPGGTGLMVCKAAQQMGLVRSYTHAFGIDQTLKALVLRPVIIGLDWYASFDSPDPKTGLIKLDTSSGVRGGHEILADEIDAESKLVGCWNSWGLSFGLGGRFYLSFDDLDALLQAQGDCTVPCV